MSGKGSLSRYALTVLLLGAAPSALTADDPEIDWSRVAATAAVEDTADGLVKRAMQQLAAADPVQVSAGRDLLQQAARRGISLARWRLGQALCWGWWGFEVDRTRGLQWIRLAAEGDLREAQVTYGLMLAAGWGPQQDHVAAATWLMTVAGGAAPSAWLGTSPPQVLWEAPDLEGRDPLAGIARFGLGMLARAAGDWRRAHEHFAVAMECGVARAARMVAVDCFFGIGTKRNFKQAAAAWEDAEELPLKVLLPPDEGMEQQPAWAPLHAADEELATALAAACAEGASRFLMPQVQLKPRWDRIAPEGDPDVWITWLRRAEELGESWAPVARGMVLAGGTRGAVDPAAAVRCWEQAIKDATSPHPQAVANLVIAYSQGLGVTRDPAHARSLAEAHRGEHIACLLATKGKCPEQFVDTEAQMQLLKQWAEKQRDPDAMLRLARVLENGLGGEVNQRSAGKWLAAAAETGLPEARLAGLSFADQDIIWPVSRGVEKQLEEAVDVLQELAKAGVVPAQLRLGSAYFRGLGVSSSWEQSIAWYQRVLAQDADNVEALVSLSQVFRAWFLQAVKQQRFDRAKGFRERAMEFARPAADAGNDEAAELLGILLLDTRFGDAEPERARPYLQTAADHGLHHAQYFLAGLLETDRANPEAQEEALFYYQLASAGGQTDALRRAMALKARGRVADRNVGWELRLANRLYARGYWGVVQVLGDYHMRSGDFERAVQLWESLEEIGDSASKAVAAERLSRCYELGLGVEEDAGRARVYLEKAADMGHGGARYRLALRLIEEERAEEGVAMLQDAMRDSADAAYALGQMYYFGQYVSADRLRALDCLRSAAVRDQRDALFFLAALTVKAEPQAPALAEAIDFAERARKLGHPQAELVLDKLSRLSGATAEP